LFQTDEKRGNIKRNTLWHWEIVVCSTP